MPRTLFEVVMQILSTDAFLKLDVCFDTLIQGLVINSSFDINTMCVCRNRSSF